MALTFSDAIASIKNNNWFRTRVEAATSNYTNYLINTDPSDPNYDAKIQAGTRLASQSQQAIETLMFTLSGDQEVIQAGPAIPEAQLQMIVEKTLNKLYPVQVIQADGSFKQVYLQERKVEKVQ